MTKPTPGLSGHAAAISRHSLASALDQSVDCVKLIDGAGRITYLNPNGLCAMEIDQPAQVIGINWAGLWPAEGRALIDAAYNTARDGNVARFRAYCPTAKGQDRWWDVTVSALRDDDGAFAGFLGVSRDVTEQEIARQVLETGTRELRHRLKNTYTMVASLLRSFGRGAPQTAEFASTMAERITAIGRAQALFTSDDVPCSLAELCQALVTPFATQACPVSLDAVADLPVDRALADTIALVLGELAVNASKHGALAHGGDIVLSAQADGGAIVMVWHETAQQPVTRTSRPGGQGLALIERIVRLRQGRIELAWRADGLDATLRFGT